jgi:hypothetical protein
MTGGPRIQGSGFDAGEDLLAEREAIGAFEVVVIGKGVHHGPALRVEKVFGDTTVEDLGR